MCGRYGLTIEQDAIAAAYGVELLLTDYYPRYNIAPTQDVLVLVENDAGRRIERMRWGLVPFWAKDARIGGRMINARSETVHEKASFRHAWRERRRCLVLADGFYEWMKSEDGAPAKIPHWIQMADGRPFGFAGLWEEWRKGGEPLRSCTVLTTVANPLLRPIHDRMPVVLGDAPTWNAWVDPDIPSSELRGHLAPYPSEEMHAYPVSSYVSRPENEGPGCIQPLQAGPARDDS